MRFLLGAHKLAQLPPDDGYEVAFAGRSNVGKSSAINAITGRTALARTSKTPGRTQQLNLFAIDDDDDRRLVDMPGYGYAKVPDKVKLHWQQTMERYLETRHCLRGLILLTDIRRPLQPFETQILQWSHQADMPVHLLLTKADKLSRGRATAVLHQVRKTLAEDCPQTSAQLFSATKKKGVDEAREVIEGWLGW